MLMFMRAMKKNTFFKRYKKSILITSVILVTSVVAGGWFLVKNDSNSNNSETKSGVDSKDNINYAPPTNQDLKEAEQHKQEIIDQQKQSTEPTTGKKSVTPVIVDSSQYDNEIEVRAYVPGVIEDGGTCSITFTKGSLTVTKQSMGEKDATTTRCTNITIPRSEFKDYGKWNVTLSYSSSTTQGTASARTMEVQ